MKKFCCQQNSRVVPGDWFTFLILWEFQNCRTCVRDFREGAFYPPPIPHLWVAPKRPSWIGLTFAKDVKEISWMSRSLIHFWFLLIFFYFAFLWYSSFVSNSPCIFQRLFWLTKILLLRHSKKNYQMFLYKLDIMCEELSY